MIRKLVIAAFFIFPVFFISAEVANAQTSNQPTIINVCLKTDRCKEKGMNCTSNSSHRVRLSSDDASKPPASSSIYVTECLMYDVPNDNSSAPQYVCTTGNSALDMDLFCNKRKTDGTADVANCAGADHLSQLQREISYAILPTDKNTTGNGIYHFNGVSFERKTPASDPKSLMTRSNGNGAIPLIEWESSTPRRKTYRHTYKAWSKITTTTSSTGSVGGQQQATLDFSYKMSECSSVSFDPYGRVFDAVSLEPIPGSISGGDINVQLSQKDDKGNFTIEEVQKQNISLDNPVSPLADGVFAFFVADGDYKLDVIGSAMNNVYEFRDTPATFDAFNNVYKDIYYKNSPAIEQRGQIQHRDIPLYPKDNSGKSYPIQVLSLFQDGLNNGDVRFHGQVSHPYAKMTVYPICEGTPPPPWKEYTYKNNSGAPDKDGKFDILIRQSDLCTGGRYNVVFEKINLRDSNLFGMKIHDSIISFFKKLIPSFTVQAQDNNSTSITLNPIPLYIEGFAYNAKGKLIPNATVQVHITQTDLPIYTTKADANGFFRITSEYLPRYPYTLTFVGQDKKVFNINTSQFLQQNADFVQKEKINVYRLATSSTNPRQNITPSYIPKQTVALNISPSAGTQNSNSLSGTPAPQPANQSVVMLVGVVLLLLLGAAGIMLGVYIYKKNSTPPEVY